MNQCAATLLTPLPLPFALQERAAREAAEKERLLQQNHAARQAAQQRVLQERAQQRLQEQEAGQKAAAAKRRPAAGGVAVRGSMYLQRLRVQKSGHVQGAGLQDWARPARPLPPLLPPKPAAAQAQQQAQVALERAASLQSVALEAAAPAPMQLDGQHRQLSKQPAAQQQPALGGQGQRGLTDEERELEAALGQLDALLPHRAGGLQHAFVSEGPPLLSH